MVPPFTGAPADNAASTKKAATMGSLVGWEDDWKRLEANRYVSSNRLPSAAICSLIAGKLILGVLSDPALASTEVLRTQSSNSSSLLLLAQKTANIDQSNNFAMTVESFHVDS